jgi:putative ABC transport system ATP-binding protein
VLEISQLAYAYDGGAALEVDQFRLSPGQHAILLGHSGSGKSTLLNLIAGILSMQSGTLKVAGTDLSTLSPRETDAWRGATIGFVPQQLALIPSMTARENILLSAYASGAKPHVERADALLSILGIAAHVHRKPAELSQGQRQRVALARAAYSSPRLLLADEPTANLDDHACSIAISLLTTLALTERSSLIIATHDARVVAALPGAQVLRLEALMAAA